MFKLTFIILVSACCYAMAQNALFKIPLGNSVLLGQARYGYTPLSYARNLYGVNSLGLNPLGGAVVSPYSNLGGLTSNGAVVAPGTVVAPGAVVAPGTIVGSSLTGTVPVTNGLTGLTGLTGYSPYTAYNSLYSGYGGYGGGMNIPTTGVVG
uniref:Uncharacterized protein n=1 Tax=Panagrolaimus superbus TaxID=310955 RepID=A0A914Y4N7_9BILA